MTKISVLIALAAMTWSAGARAQDTATVAYLDDRSTPAAVIGSLYNAINRHDYARAWSYWGEGPDRPDYETFRDGYADTAFVSVVVGEAFAEGAAGSIYYTLPVAIEALDVDGTTQVFAGCYVLRLGQPTIQEPPFRPMHIVSGTLAVSDVGLKPALPDSCAP